MPRKISDEATILLAIKSIEEGKFRSARAAGKALGPSHVTISNRMKGRLSKEDSAASQEKMTKPEQEAIIQQALDMDSRGYALELKDLAVMANLLIDHATSQHRNHVGKTWAKRFVAKTPRLRTRMSRPYDYERASCEDPRVLKEWYRVLKATMDDLGILDEDIWNFDETGFMMGKIQGRCVVTATDRRRGPKRIQPGNR